MTTFKNYPEIDDPREFWDRVNADIDARKPDITPVTLKDLDEWSKTPEGQAFEAKLQLAAQRLKERYSHVPFHAERAKRKPNYWRTLASSAVNA